MKRFLSVLLCMVMVSGILSGSVFLAAAEESDPSNPTSDTQPQLSPEATPEIITSPFATVFNGGDHPTTIKNVGEGVIWRSESQSGLFKALSSVRDLTLAYLECDKGVLIVNEPVKWTVLAEGGSGDYQYALDIYHTDGDPYESTYYYKKGFAFTNSNVFTYTPLKAGFYLIQVYIKDSEGNQLVWLTDAFDAAVAADEGKINTVAGKVEYLKSKCLSNASTPYARAKWMHDWLVNNADYDYTYSNYSADGVLLKGSGVCDSYSSAYYLLMKAVGIPSIEVSNDGHSWNMVKLDGYWYHVDVTWDDPLRYTYFLRSDAFIRSQPSHKTWTKRNGVAPESPFNWGEAGLLAAPASISTAAVSETIVKVSWAAVTGAAGYELWRASSKTGTYAKVYGGTANAFNNHRLTPGVPYYYKVRAYKTAGTTKSYSTYSAVKIGAALDGLAITKIEAVGGTSLKITWNKLSGASGYEVWRSTSKTGTYKLVKTTTALSFTNTYLKAGTRYFYKIQAYTLTEGEKSPAGNISAIVAGVPLAKSAIVSATGVSKTQIKLTWKKVTGATGYQILRSTTPGGTYKSIKLTTALTYTVGGMKAGTSYYFKVRSYKQFGTVKYYSPLSGYKAGRTK